MPAPWTWGPREILRHALFLLRRDNDTNRRLALLSTDNAMELMMKTYLGLPRRVTGLNISRKEFEEIGEKTMLSLQGIFLRISLAMRLIDELRDKHNFTGAKIAQPQSWYSFPSRVLAGIYYGAVFSMNDKVRAEVYLDLPDPSRNKRIFDELERKAAVLEAQFGEQLKWERLDNRRACRVASYRSCSIELSSRELVELREWFVDRLLRLKKTFGPILAETVKQI